MFNTAGAWIQAIGYVYLIKSDEAPLTGCFFYVFIIDSIAQLDRATDYESVG